MAIAALILSITATIVAAGALYQRRQHMQNHHNGRRW